jgi:hypothetical protein
MRSARTSAKTASREAQTFAQPVVLMRDSVVPGHDETRLTGLSKLGVTEPTGLLRRVVSAAAPSLGFRATGDDVGQSQ